LRTLTLAAGRWHRIHPWDAATGQFAADAFNPRSDGNARFSPLRDPTSGQVIPVLYAASSERGAIAEVLLHDVPSPSSGHLHDWERDRRSRLHLSPLALPALNVVNLTSTGLRAAGLALHDLFVADARDYPRTRAWALHLWQTQPQAQGLYWMSVRDNTSKVLMLFGDRIPAAHLRALQAPRPIADYASTVFALLDELGCGLAVG
jgi:hypothetical protein